MTTDNTPSNVSTCQTSSKDTDYWLTRAPVFTAIMHMAIPMMLGMAATAVYSFTDTLFIGFLDDTAALAAIPLTMPLMSLFMGASTFLEVGAGTFIARSLGAGNQDAAKAASSLAVLVSFIGSLVIGLAIIAFMQPIMALLGSNAEIDEPLSQYLTFYCLGAPFVVMNLVESQLLRSVADSKQASLGIVLSALLNIALDPIFIFGLDMGIAGAAFATVLANALTAIYFLTLITKSPVLSARPSDLHLSMAEVIDIAKIGSSGLIMLVLMGVGSLIFNNIAVRYGTAVVAGFGIAQNVVQMIEVVAMGLYEGIVPLIAGAWGATNTTRVKEIIRKTIVCLVIYCAITCGLLLVFRSTILGWFSSDTTVIATGIVILSAQTIAVIFESGTGLITGILQACNKGVASNIMACAKGLLLPCTIFVASVLFGLGGVIWSLLACAIITFTIGCFLITRSFSESPMQMSAEDVLVSQ